MNAEELELLGDSKYRNYVAAVDKALKNFEYSSEWADLISALGKLNKVHFYIVLITFSSSSKPDSCFTDLIFLYLLDRFCKTMASIRLCPRNWPLESAWPNASTRRCPAGYTARPWRPTKSSSRSLDQSAWRRIFSSIGRDIARLIFLLQWLLVPNMCFYYPFPPPQFWTLPFTIQCCYVCEASITWVIWDLLPALGKDS